MITAAQAHAKGLIDSADVVRPGDVLKLQMHPLGTDYLGRDMLARLMHGARVSLFIGIVAPFAFVLVGIFYGSVAGFMGGRVDQLLMRFADFVVALPFLLFMILFRILFNVQPGDNSILPMMVAMVVLSWPAVARLCARTDPADPRRGLHRRLAAAGREDQLSGAAPHDSEHDGRDSRDADVRGAKSHLHGGVSVLHRHGVAPPTPSWGSMCNEGLKTMLTTPHELIFPAAFISITVLAFNLLGDGLRDALDARMRATDMNAPPATPSAEAAPARPPLLEVADLRVEFDTYGGTVQAGARRVSFSLERGKTLAIVGESGCGKSVTVQSIMGLIPMPPGRITSGIAKIDGQDMLRDQRIGGKDIRGRLWA